MKKNLFVYLDPGFSSDLGHYKKIADRLHSFTKKNKSFDMLHYVGKNIKQEDVKKYNLIKVFKHIAFIKENNTNKELILKDFEFTVENIFSYLNILNETYENIIVYMYTSNIPYSKILLKINEKYRIDNLSINSVLFYIKHTKEEINDIKLLNTLLKKDINKNVNIYTDSEVAISYYQKLLTKRLTNLPIPLYSKNNIVKDNKNNKKSIVTYFGYPTYDHGFDLFFNLYKKLSKNKDYSFIVKLNTRLSNSALIKKIEELKVDKNVHLITSFIDNLEYERLIQQSDIVVIPYDKNKYEIQTSGVFIESILNNKLILTTKDTWMGDKIKLLGQGITFNSEKENDILKAFEELRKNKSSLNQKEIKKFKSFYTVEKLFKVFKKNYKENIITKEIEKENLNFAMEINVLNKYINELKSSNKQIALYGYGVLGQFILSNLGNKVKVIIDKNPNIKSSSHDIITLDKLTNYNIDLILISVLGRESSIVKDINKALPNNNLEIKTLPIVF